MERLVKAFATFDKDGSGTLTAAECIAILNRPTSRGPGMAYKEAQAFVAMFDANGDGVLDFMEFATAMGACRGFGVSGWEGYHGRYNGKYEPTGECRDGRPVFKHTGPGMDWCRVYWAHGFWKFGHFSFVHESPKKCCAGGQSDAKHPADIPAGTPFFEHQGTVPHHDYGSDPSEFKPATGTPYIV